MKVEIEAYDVGYIDGQLKELRVFLVDLQALAPDSKLIEGKIDGIDRYREKLNGLYREAYELTYDERGVRRTAKDKG